jgi:hypothetical protein
MDLDGISYEYHFTVASSFETVLPWKTRPQKRMEGWIVDDGL